MLLFVVQEVTDRVDKWTILVRMISKVCSTECTVPSFSGESNIKGGYKSYRFVLILVTNVYIHFLYFIYGLQFNWCFVFFLILSLKQFYILGL